MVQIVVPFSRPADAPADTNKAAPQAAARVGADTSLSIKTTQTTPQSPAPAAPQERNSYSAAETVAKNTSRGVVELARTRMGSPVAGAAVTDDCLVTLRSGQVCDVGLALRLGKLVRDAGGSLSEPGRTPAVQQQTQQQPGAKDTNDPDKTDNKPDDAPSYDLFDDAGEALVGDVANGVSNLNVEAAIGAIASGNEIDDDTLGRIASSQHREPEQVREQVGQVREMFELQAQQKVRDSGLDPDMLFAWAYAERPKLMNVAIRQHLHSRSTRAYEPVMDAYIEALPDIDPNLALNVAFGDGTTVRKGPKGEVLVKLRNGMETSWKAAVKAGYIKLGHRRR